MKLSDIITEGEERSIIRDAVVQQLVDTFGESPGLFADNQEELVAKMYSDLEAMNVEDVVDPGMEVGGQPIGNFASGGVLNVIDSNSAIEDALQHINLADLEEAEVGESSWRAKQQQLKNKQKRNFQQGAVSSTGKYSQQARQKAATRDYQSASVKLPDGRLFNNSAQGWQEVDKKGNPVPGTQPLSPTSAQAKELNKIYQNKGKPPQGFMSKMKDKFTKKLGGQFATKTLADPDANLGKRMGAVAGAGIGRGLGNLIRSKPKGPVKVQGKNALSSQSHRQLGALQQKVMSTGDVEAAKALVDMLSAKSKKGADPAEISNYANTVAPILKRNKEFQKNNPQVYKNLVTLARQMRKESYEHLCRVLEHANLTWEDLGFRVSLTESNVILFPHEELTQIEESIALEELKVLAGV